MASGAKKRRAAQVVAAIRAADEALPKQARKAKYRKMRVSPFAFFRGTNHLFWADFAADPRLRPEGDADAFGSPATRTWLGGDAHVGNLGAFGNARGEVVYALNDFDEAIVHDYRYDLWRMAASVVLVARENGGFGRKDQRRLVRTLTGAYLAALAGPESAAALTAATARGRLGKFLRQVEQRDAGADVRRWTRRARNGRRFDLSHPDLGEAGAGLREQLEGAVGEYLATAMYARRTCDPDDFTIEDVAARRDAGIGSLGRARYYLLIGDRREGEPDHRILDVKEQRPPAARAILTPGAAATYDGVIRLEGQRHALAFHAMTPEPDPFLGWLQIDGASFSVRERSPFKRSFDTSKLTRAKRFRRVTEQWGALLAAQHRLGDRNITTKLEDHLEVELTEDQRRLVALDHQLAPAVLELAGGREAACCDLAADVALRYADQVAADWKAFRQQVPG